MTARRHQRAPPQKTPASRLPRRLSPAHTPTGHYARRLAVENVLPCYLSPQALSLCNTLHACTGPPHLHTCRENCSLSARDSVERFEPPTPATEPRTPNARMVDWIRTGVWVSDEAEIFSEHFPTPSVSSTTYGPYFDARVFIRGFISSVPQGVHVLRLKTCSL
jgi:hypothetical protein